MREPGAIVLLALVITLAIRAFWMEIVQFVLILLILAVVTGLIFFGILIVGAAAGQG